MVSGITHIFHCSLFLALFHIFIKKAWIVLILILWRSYTFWKWGNHCISTKYSFLNYYFFFNFDLASLEYGCVSDMNDCRSMHVMTHRWASGDSWGQCSSSTMRPMHWTQILKLAWQALLAAESSCWHWQHSFKQF